MSQVEMQRFAADLRTKAELAAEVKRQAGLDTVIAAARACGYCITLEDVKHYIYDRSAGLMHEKVPGGRRPGPS